MNINQYLCTYEALYLNSLITSSEIGLIYGDITFHVWGDRSELEFMISEPIQYEAGFFKFTERMGYKSKIEAYPDYDPLVVVLL
jgi:hypothetical protein